MIILRRVAACLAGLFLCLVESTLAQQASPQSVVRDPRAVAIVTQAIASAGGLDGVAAVQDLSASGTITFNWAGESVTGDVTVKGRGLTRFRLDATLPDGVHSRAVSNGRRFGKNPDGTVVISPYGNRPCFENVPFALAQLLEAMQDSSTNLTYVALESRNGSSVNHIRIAKLVLPDSDPTGIASKIGSKPGTIDVFVDSTTNLIQSVITVAYLADFPGQTYPRELQYSGYQKVSGLVLPSSIVELIDGQQTLSIQLNQISLNSGLSDSDFEP